MKTIQYLVLSILLFSAVSCEKTFFEAEPDSDPVSIFEQFWGTYNTDYALFDERGVDWDEIYATYRPLVTEQTTDEELYNILKEMLSGLNDSHIIFTVPDKQIYTPNLYYGTHFEDELFDIEVVRDNYFTQDAIEYDGGWVVTSWIGDVAYMWFKGVGSGFLEFNTMLDGFSNASSLIIDLRHNGGGDLTFALSEIGRLTDEKRLTHLSQTKNGPGPNDYDEWFEWYITPSGDYFDKPLVLLTDRYTVSAGERATIALKTLPNLTHMGDTTNGSHSTMIGKELSNGWYFTICPQNIECIDGKSYEGIGLIPEVLVENSMEDMSVGIDAQLEAALTHLQTLNK